jgi:hypothetical protein
LSAAHEAVSGHHGNNYRGRGASRDDAAPDAAARHCEEGVLMATTRWVHYVVPVMVEIDCDNDAISLLQLIFLVRQRVRAR